MTNERFPLISIITPVYNGAEYLRELVESVRAQDYPNLEHIVIDDGSNDGGATLDVLKAYPHLRWWSRENRGQYATMNEGLQAARGEIVCFICADDLMQPGALWAAARWFEAHPGFEAVYGLTGYISEQGRPLSIKHFVRYAPIKYYPYFAQIQHCSLYVLRKALMAKGLFFQEHICYVADYDWIIRMIKASLPIGFIDARLSAIRVHPRQISTLNRSEMNAAQYQVAASHGYGGLKYGLYINILHVFVLAEQLRDAFDAGGMTGVIAYLKSWGKNKFAPLVMRKLAGLLRPR